ncbi:MAG: site-specific integrase [Pseudomonadota bacterium]
MSNKELKSLWKAAENQPFPWQQSLKLMLFTAARRSEVFGAERAEFDLEEKVWNLPASSAKNNNTVIIPLTDDACRIVSDCPQSDGCSKLFPSATNPKTSASGISKMLKRLRADVEADLQRPVPHWTLHDIRRTVATNLQRLGVRLEVTEAILNHISGSQAGIVKVYQRYDWMDEKREALQLWSDDLVRICD